MQIITYKNADWKTKLKTALKNSFIELNQDFNELKPKTKEHNNNVAELKKENKELREENKGVRNDVAKLKKENNELHNDVAELKKENKGLADKVDKGNRAFAALADKLEKKDADRESETKKLMSLIRKLEQDMTERKKPYHVSHHEVDDKLKENVDTTNQNFYIANST